MQVTSRLVAGCGESFYSRNMLVDFTADQEAQLSQIAARQGVDPALLVKDAALKLLADEERFRVAVREGIAQADRGELIDSTEMDAIFQKMLNG